MASQLKTISKPFILLILFLTMISLRPTHISAETPTNPTYFTEVCRPIYGNYTLNSPYESNLKHALSRLRNHSSSSPYNTTAVGEHENRAYAQYYCRGDIATPLCRDCVRAATHSLLKNCSLFKAAIMWYEECTLQYGNHSLVGMETEHPASWWFSPNNVSDTAGNFGVVLNTTMDGIINEAAHGNGSLHFATGEGVVSPVETAYSLVQCRPDMNGTQCENCLRSAYGFVPNCCGNRAEWVFVFYPSCQLRYSTTGSFYALPNGTASPPSVQPSPSPSPVPLVQPSPPSPPPPLVQPSPPPTMVTGSATAVHRREGMKQGLVVATLAFLMFGAIA